MIVYLALAVSALAVFYAAFLHYKLAQFTKGQDGKSLESKIKQILKENETIFSQNEELKKLALDILKKDKLNLKSFALVKFNPFSESGHGKQSFALAVLNEKGDGVLLSTLSVRGETHVFIKEVSKETQKGNLTEEEFEALEKARNKLYNS